MSVTGEPDYVDDSAIGLTADGRRGRPGASVACWRAADRSALREWPRLPGALVPLDLIPVVVELNAFRKPSRWRWMLKDHHPTRAPRLPRCVRLRVHRAPLTASCRALDSPRRARAICCSGGCRVVRAGRGAEITPDRSASSPTREGLDEQPHGYPCHAGGIQWRQLPWKPAIATPSDQSRHQSPLRPSGPIDPRCSPAGNAAPGLPRLPGLKADG